MEYMEYKTPHVNLFRPTWVTMLTPGPLIGIRMSSVNWLKLMKIYPRNEDMVVFS